MGCFSDTWLYRLQHAPRHRKKSGGEWLGNIESWLWRLLHRAANHHDARCGKPFSGNDIGALMETNTLEQSLTLRYAGLLMESYTETGTTTANAG